MDGNSSVRRHDRSVPGRGAASLYDVQNGSGRIFAQESAQVPL